MIIPELGGGLAPRQSYGCPSGYHLRNGRCYQNNWSYWGRWVLAAVVIVFFLSLFVIWSCISNRRRRRQGLNPRYGTAWFTPGAANNAGGYPQHQQQGGGWGWGKNNNNQQPYQQPYQQPQPPYQAPPQYTPAQGQVPQQYTGQTFNSNEGYYGQHSNDIPLQQPASSYYPRGGDNVYEPPSGPPPAKS